jgi:hypothetical protein
VARNIGRFALKAEISGASLCSVKFQYPRFWEQKVGDGLPFSERPVRTSPTVLSIADVAIE